MGLGRDKGVAFVSLSVSWSMYDDLLIRGAVLVVSSAASVRVRNGLEVCFCNRRLGSPCGISDDFSLAWRASFGGIQVVMMHKEQCRGAAETVGRASFAFNLSLESGWFNGDNFSNQSVEGSSIINMYPKQP